MYACPTCHQKGIRILAKWLSWPSVPAKCRRCGALFTSPVQDSGTVVVASALGVTAAGFASIYIQAAWPVWLAVLLTVLALLMKWHLQPLLSLTPAQITAARRGDAVGTLLVVCTFLFQ